MEPGCVMEQEESHLFKNRKNNNYTETLQSALSNVCGGILCIPMTE